MNLEIARAILLPNFHHSLKIFAGQFRSCTACCTPTKDTQQFIIVQSTTLFFLRCVILQFVVPNSDLEGVVNFVVKGTCYK